MSYIRTEVRSASRRKVLFYLLSAGLLSLAVNLWPYPLDTRILYLFSFISFLWLVLLIESHNLPTGAIISLGDNGELSIYQCSNFSIEGHISPSSGFFAGIYWLHIEALSEQQKVLLFSDQVSDRHCRQLRRQIIKSRLR